MVLEKNKVYCMDAIEFLKQLPDKSVDLILTDPPYNLDFSKFDTLSDSSGNKFHNTDELDWDSVDRIDLKQLGIVLFKELDRVVKETGSVIIFGPQQWAYYYHGPAEENNFRLKCQMVWVKTNPIPQLRHKNYRSGHENIAWYGRYNENKVPYTFNFINQKEMSNVFYFPILGGSERLRDENNNALHPTQKPLELIRKLVKIHSNENDLIVDMFIGSGTTAVAAWQLGRNFMGCDIDQKYVDVANNRVEEYVKQKGVFDF